MKGQVKTMINYRLSNLKMISSLLLTILLMAGTAQLSFGSNSGDKLTDRVNSAIAKRYDIENFDITNLGNGDIQIEGTVKSLYNRLRIFEIVSHVRGVKKISNNIIVQTDLVPDDIIKANIREDINRNSLIKEPQKISVHVDNGLVILSGKVSFFREKLEAATIASSEKGVKSLANNIELLPVLKALSDENLKGILHSVLLDEFPLTNPKNVNISVENGVVTVSGTVSDLWTKNNIKDEFSSVLGIVGVINNLKVNPDMNS